MLKNPKLPNLKTIFLLSFCISIFNICNAQQNNSQQVPEVDSLQLENIFWFSLSDPEKATRLTDIVESKKLEKQYKIDDMRGLIAYHGYHKFNLALHYFRKSLPGAIDNNDDIRIIYTVRMILMSNFMLDNFEGLETEIDLLYKTAEKLNDIDALSLAIYSIGRIHYKSGNREKAFEYFDQAIDMLDKQTDDYTLQSAINYCGEIGTFLTEAGDAEKALTYLLKSEKYINQRVADNPTLASHINFHKFGIYAHLANTYYSLNQKDKAEEYYLKTVELKQSVGIIATFSLHSYLYKSGRYDEMIENAIEIVNYSYSLSDTISEPVRVSYGYLKDAYEKKQDYEKANIYANKLISLLINKHKKISESNALEYATIYELNKYISEKERQRLYLYFSFGLCIILIITLLIWIYFSRKISLKNRTLAQQIKELIAQQEIKENEILSKTTFINSEDKISETTEDGFCPETRKDKLCLAIRDVILKEKIYRNPAITRDQIIEKLGTNKELFIEAFAYCFKMPFNDYINTLRLKDSVILLQQSDLSIEVISEKVGFGTVRTFQRQFNEKYNMTPKDYRGSMKK